MTEPPRAVVAALLLLTLVTGIVDAASVLGLGHVFTANMTGNVVFLGFALVGQGTTSALASLLALASFSVGALVGGLTLKAFRPAAIRLAFGIELATLMLAAGLAAAADTMTLELVGLLAFAMGLRNAVVRKLAVADLTTTVLTLTITGLAADSTLAGGNNTRWRRRVLAIVVMLAGATLGAVLLPTGMAWVVAAAALLEVVAVALVVRHAASFFPPVDSTASSSRSLRH
jgi:uncharacterized membrane protein YoaK (UPF0700 family)